MMGKHPRTAKQVHIGWRCVLLSNGEYIAVHRDGRCAVHPMGDEIAMRDDTGRLFANGQPYLQMDRG